MRGTFSRRWNSVSEWGLLAGGTHDRGGSEWQWHDRNRIHFAPYDYFDKRAIFCARTGCDAVIYIDLRKATLAGILFQRNDIDPQETASSRGGSWPWRLVAVAARGRGGSWLTQRVRLLGLLLGPSSSWRVIKIRKYVGVGAPGGSPGAPGGPGDPPRIVPEAPRKIQTKI